MLTRVSTTVEELTPTFDLSSKGIASRELVFGRIADSDIFLNTESLPLLISRKHAVISLAGDTLSIQDTGSINGTYVNNQRLLPSQPRVLREGNLVSFGGPQKIVRDGLTHSNPFVYKLSAISALSNNNNAAREARRAASATATPSGEQAVDLTRTTSLEPGPSDIVDLTNSPDVQADHGRLHRGASSRQPRESRLQSVPLTEPQQGHAIVVRSLEAGHKRAKALAVPVSSARELPEASQAAAIPADISAKKALENEFECIICRDFMVATHSVVPCGHMFCGECLSQWLQKNPSCPKCRAAATGWVQTIAVDNVLESLVEKTMTPDELQERRRKKQNWEANSAQISNRMKNVFRGPAMPRVPVHRAGWQAADMSQAAMQAVAAGVVVPGYGGMMVPGGLHPENAVNFIPDQYRPPHRMHAAPRAPAPAPQPQVNYTVAYNVSAHRTLCKNCRNPIASNSLKIGYRDRPQQMRWYHLGCLPADAWQQASLPGRLEGLPDLPPAQRGDVQGYLNR